MTAEPVDAAVNVPDLGRIAQLVDLAYEAACDAADRDLVDWSLIGEPLAEVLAILRRAA